MEADERIASDGQAEADHLCVLIHGLWGNSKHMTNLANAVRTKHAADKLHILVARTNSDTFTYDGIDLGAERVTQEIERYIADLEDKGTRLRKISIVGYSLGGLIARYVVGLLSIKGWLDKLEPVNFTTFASPHLGTRTPTAGYTGKLWNFLGASTLSVSGQQLFLIDNFRDTDRQLISILADPGLIFMQALAQFKNRILYANIVNDRSTPYYTSSISCSDPFAQLDSLDLHYVPNYGPTILDPVKPISSKPPPEESPFTNRLLSSSKGFLSSLPLFVLLGVLVPIGSVAFLINSGVQNFRSSRRIRQYRAGKSSIGLGDYKIPLMVENVRGTIEHAIVNVSGQTEMKPSEDDVMAQQSRQENGHASVNGMVKDQHIQQALQLDGHPLLALSKEQLDMIDALDDLGFKKYRVNIKKVRHTHAAIIRRINRKSFEEGGVVIRHWLDEEFEI